MRDCADYIELISARLDGELTDGQEAELSAHLAACPACRALAADMAALHEELPKLAAEPPADLMENVMARIRAETPAPIPFPAEQTRKTPHRKWRAWGATAAVLAVVILGAATLRMGGPSGGMSGGAPAEAPLLAANDNEAGRPSADGAPVPEPSAAPASDQEPVTFSIGGGETKAARTPEAEPAAPPAGQPESTPQPSAEPRISVQTGDAPHLEEAAPAEGETGKTAEDTPAQKPMGVMTAIPPEESAPADAGEAFTEEEALEFLYADLFAGSYPDAERTEENGSIGYILSPFHPVGDSDPDGQLVSLRVRYWGEGDGGSYYVFLVYNEFVDYQPDWETRGSHVQFLAVPTGGEGDILMEPTDSGEYADFDAYEAAKAAFWDEVDQ